MVFSRLPQGFAFCEEMETVVERAEQEKKTPEPEVEVLSLADFRKLYRETTYWFNHYGTEQKILCLHRQEYKSEEFVQAYEDLNVKIAEFHNKIVELKKNPHYKNYFPPNTY